jgi:adenylate cyclase
MLARFTVYSSDGVSYEIAVGNTATIGRSADNTISLEGSHVSRQHAIVRCHNAGYQIMDLGSRNGTFVDGQRVVMPMVLQSGARVKIAEYELVFDQWLEEEDESKEAEVSLASTMGEESLMWVAILLCDIRGSSLMAEQVEEGFLARFIGHWFRDAGSLIQGARGVIDKYIGDAVLAYWSGEDQSDECLKVAGDLLRLANERRWPGSDTLLRVGVVLHFGRVTSSNIGQVAMRDATILGDTVNTTFRLEELMKKLDQDLLLTQDFVETLSNREGLVDLGEFQLRGKNQAIHVFCRRLR